MGECSKLISEVKANYLSHLGNILNDPFLGPKNYWANRNRISLIPPILHNVIFATDMIDKANINAPQF